ncbi:MAG: DUF427 domain-containing protein [Euzebyales bacterium]|jgi:uncharacterized protein (DUF427 family)|nr:DUF427 domain-containing protein [Euzebyales bacterium]
MTLTLSDGPLAADPPASVNYTVDGPAHKILFANFPRRVRATFADEVVLDTTRGRLLHESNLLPVLYVPTEDVRQALLQATDHSTHCPFKGDASYWSVVVGDRTADDAVWGYPEPNGDAGWLAGYMAFYWDRMDAWFDEDEQVHGHLRDPYHRIDTRRSSRRVVVRRGDEVLAESSRPIVVSETGLPNRFYLPVADVRTDLLTSSTSQSHCPYKGWATYWSLRDGTADVAWSYEEPFTDAAQTAGHLCFSGDDVVTEVDGQVVDS